MTIMLSSIKSTSHNLPPTESRVYTISELNQLTHTLLESAIGQLWICGEISNLSIPNSGHCYFSLKDKNAQVRCALFRSAAQKLTFSLQNGQHVMAYAAVSLYEPRGDFQLIVSRLGLAGDGALQLEFEQLKRRLAAEGLFDTQHKKPIPTFPKTIGVITSPTGAAIRDILTVLKRRFATIPVIIYPSLVQGKEAPPQLVHALKLANMHKQCDVLILARGGGSLEDLWPFNEEMVARAIFASEIPVVTGIGHEMDITIADFVADLRAATPSVAAERVSPDQREWQQRLEQITNRLQLHIHTKFKYLQLKLSHIQHRLQHPGQRLQQQMQWLDQCEQHLYLAQQHVLRYTRERLQQNIHKLIYASPQHVIKFWQQALTQLQQRLNKSMQHILLQQQARYQHAAHTLQAISPLTTLQRGFAIAQFSNSHVLIYQDNQVKTGDLIDLRLAQGQITCQVI